MKIAAELKVFLSAFFSGIFLSSLYMALGMLRKLWKHSLLIINLEDIIYWSVTCGYLFVQIYHTNNGIIRSYYVLGVVFGAWFMWKISRFFSEKWKKFVHSHKKKSVD